MKQNNDNFISDAKASGEQQSPSNAAQTEPASITAQTVTENNATQTEPASITAQAVTENNATQDPNTSDGKTEKTRFIKGNDVLLLVLIGVLLLFALCKTFFITNIKIIGASMSPTYSDGEVVWINKLATPNRGDVIILYEQVKEGKIKLFKRLVAVGGDTIEFVEKEGAYLLRVTTPNGEQTEHYCAHKKGVMHLDTPYVLLAEEIFVLGDNRDASDDSRAQSEYFVLDDVVGVVISPRSYQGE